MERISAIVQVSCCNAATAMQPRLTVPYVGVLVESAGDRGKSLKRPPPRSTLKDCTITIEKPFSLASKSWALMSHAQNLPETEARLATYIECLS